MSTLSCDRVATQGANDFTTWNNNKNFDHLNCHLEQQHLSQQQNSNDRNCMSTSVIFIRDIYSSSSLHKKPPNHKNHNFPICHESFQQPDKLKSILFLLLFKQELQNDSLYSSKWPAKHSWHTSARVTASKIKSRDLYYVTINVFCHHKRSLANGTSGMRHCDNNTKHLFNTLISGYAITAVHNRITNTHENLNRRSGHRRSDVFRIFKLVLTSRRSKLTKLAIANPSIISSSWELDSRLFLRGGRGVLLEDVERGGAFLPGLRSRSEPDEGLRLRVSPARASRFRPLSRCERDLRLCFTFPSILKTVRCPPPSPP